MAGGLMQLLATGAADQYLTASPEMSFYKQAYKRHTPFAMESVRQTFLTKPVLQQQARGSFTCRIGRVADLLQEVYFSFVLPDIFSDEDMRFQWVKHVAHYMIYSYSVRLDSVLIDDGYGEWLDVWNELSLPEGKRAMYDRMIGNVSAYTSPAVRDQMVIITNNRVEYAYYPVGVPGSTDPSIPSRRFFVPLPFWFTRNPSLALPLVALQYQNLDVTLELRSAEELYQLWDNERGVYWSPAKWRSMFPQDAARSLFRSFLAPADALSNEVDLDAYLECNFVFLGDDERKYVAYTPVDLLVERVYRSEREGIRGPTTMDLTLSMPVKEMIWITRRGDAKDRNEWSNLTNRFPENENAPILKTAKLLWNGMDRFEEKPSAFFNLLQVYQHHSSTAREGIYCYSFALYPEKLQPSGTFNASMVSKIQLYLTTQERESEDYEYEVIVYSLYYNVFRIMAGSGSMVFAN